MYIVCVRHILGLIWITKQCCSEQNNVMFGVNIFPLLDVGWRIGESDSSGDSNLKITFYQIRSHGHYIHMGFPFFETALIPISMEARWTLTVTVGEPNLYFACLRWGFKLGNYFKHIYCQLKFKAEHQWIVYFISSCIQRCQLGSGRGRWDEAIIGDLVFCLV